MSTVAYALGTPRPAASRGGDCRAHDLDQDRNVHGPHRFAATTDCQISNGMLRLTVGASASAPSLTVEAWRGRVIVGDVYESVYTSVYPGSYSTPSWFAMGTLTIDSPAVSALLTAVRIVRMTPEAVTIRLKAALMADAFVTLRRGMRAVSIQHGSTRTPLVDIDRRIRWTSAGALTGTAYTSRVQEDAPATEAFPRFVCAFDTNTATAGTFSITSSSVTTARFGAGVGTRNRRDRPLDLHRQLGDASRSRLVVA